ncbi:MAG: DUF2490 domain-containing protein [Candidatus Omnitrophica bacterium]|nr:DUF2490 domain-containing protein [Candidatus Omnitrophota bacterium]
MKRILTVILVISINVVSMPVLSFAFDNGDLQVWNTESIETNINDKLKIKVEEELRFGGDVSELYYEHTDGGFTYNVTKGFDFGLNYRQICEKKDGSWKTECRPHGNVIFKTAWQGFKISDRNRFELRCPDGKADKWRYRNKLSVTGPWKWTQFNIQPYVADEVFVDFHGDRLTRNRLYSGIKANLLAHLKSDVFYLCEFNKSSSKEWTYNNVIGIKVKLDF